MKHYGFLLATAGLLSFSAPPRAEEPNDEEVARLIVQLGSDRFADREKAQERLLAMKKSPPQLQKACRSLDLETRTRACRIVSVIDARLAALPVARVERLAKEGRFDEAVEHAVRWESFDRTGKNLVPLAALARSLRQKAGEQIKAIRSPVKMAGGVPLEASVERGRESLSFYSSDKPIAVEISRGAMVRAAGVDIKESTSLCAFIVSSGPVTLSPTKTSACVAFACGPVRSSGTVKAAIIVTDGDIDIDTVKFSDSILIARGDVNLPCTYFLTNTIILAGGKITLHKESKDIPKPGSIMRENDLSGLGIIKFFDPKSVGIEVEAGTDGVKVKRVRKETPFGKVLRVGDVVTAIDRSRTPTPEVFRRVLRKALADVGSEMVVSIRRDGATKQVEIPVEP